MPLMLRLPPLLAALFLAGCGEVRFEQIPGGPYRACEPSWVGDWSVIEFETDSGSEAVDSVLRVEAECAAFHLLAFKDGAWILEEDVSDIVFSSTSKHRIIGFVAPISGTDEEKISPLVAVWTQQDDAIDIALPDVRKSAQLLVDRTDYAGTVTRSVLRDVQYRDGFTYHIMNVEFSGTSEALARLLDQEEILEAPSIRLIRIPAEEQARLDPLLRAAIKAADRADVVE